MGAEESKNVKKEYFSEEEKSTLAVNIRKIASGKDEISVAALEKHLSDQLNNAIGQRFIKLLLKGRNISSLSLGVAIKELGSLLKGSLEEQLNLTVVLAGGGKEGITTENILQYTKVLLESYCHQISSSKGYKGWNNSSPESCQKIAKALLHDLLFDNASFKEVWEDSIPSKTISFDCVERWYFGHTILSRIQMEVLKSCLNYNTVELTAIIPKASQLPKTFPSLLSAPEVLYLNSCIPAMLQKEWRFVFSTNTHGWSFSIFMKQIVGKGPTFLLIEDQSGNKFGGFAPVSWEVRPQFHGTPECFLFALHPQTGIFHSTGYNKNFMYLNYLEKNTMPNGLGMGGREELFGLWLDYDFGVGKVAPTCTTFRSPPISPNQDLQIKNIEVWALGEEEVDSDEEEGTRKSALNRNHEARAMLDMMGKVAHSDGYREEEEED